MATKRKKAPAASSPTMTEADVRKVVLNVLNEQGIKKPGEGGAAPAATTTEKPNAGQEAPTNAGAPAPDGKTTDGEESTSKVVVDDLDAAAHAVAQEGARRVMATLPNWTGPFTGAIASQLENALVGELHKATTKVLGTKNA